MSRRRNGLLNCCDTLEQRVLLSATTGDTGEQSGNENTDDETAALTEASFVTDAIRSSKGTNVRSNSVHLSVVAERDSDDRDFVYTWSTVSSPESGNVHFSRNGNGGSSGTRADFDRAGDYVIQVTIADRDGHTATRQVMLSVVQEPTTIAVRSENGSVVNFGKEFHSTNNREEFTSIVYDQFGHQIEMPKRLVWVTSSEFAKDSYFINQQSISLQDIGGNNTQTVRLGAGNLRLHFDVRFGQETPAAPPIQTKSQQIKHRPMMIGADRTSSAVPNRPEMVPDERALIDQSEDSTYLVSNDRELKEAINNAKSGDVILLESGAVLGDLKIHTPENQFSGMVTIRSADLSNRATLSSIILVGAKYITIENVNVVTTERSSAVVINRSSDIRLLNIDITANHDPYQAPSKLVKGVDLRDSQRVQLIANDFHNLGSGFSVVRSSTVLLQDNVFKDNLKDNANFGSDIEDITIQRNTFSSSVAKLHPGHHYDNIQFWVQKDATKDSRDITITENVILDLTGAVNSQAIFGRGDYYDSNGDPNPFGFVNLEIKNNLIMTQQSNAIAFTEVDGLLIDGNTLVYSGDSTNPDYGNVPGIRASLSSNVSIINNIVPDRPNYPDFDTDDFRDNVRYQIQSRELANLLVNPYSDEFRIENFATMTPPDRNSASTAKGAFVASSGDERPAALFTMSHDAVGGEISYTFDASSSLPVLGGDLDQASYRWTFADGTQATGRIVDKVFDQAGVQSATLVVTDQQGRTSTIVKQGLSVLDSDVLNLDFEGDLSDDTSTASHIKFTETTQFVSRSNGGSALAVGGGNGHLYLDAGESDFAGVALTREFSVAMSLQAELNSDGRFIEVLNRHGAWNVRINRSSGEMHLSINGKFHRFTPPVNLLDGEWHDLAFTATQDRFAFLIDGQTAHELNLTQDQADTLFTGDGHGMAIGSSGPWNSSRAAAFNLDNLYLSSSAMADQDMIDFSLENGVLA